MTPQLGRRADLEQAAVDEHADPVRERGRVLEVVGDEDRGQAEPGEEVTQLPAHRVTRVCVERRERLVEQEHAGLPCERTRKGDSLALSPGEASRALVRRAARSATGP